VDPTLVFCISNNFKLVIGIEKQMIVLIIQQTYIFEVENQTRIWQPKDNHEKFIGVLKIIWVCARLTSCGKECKMFYGTFEDLKFDHGLWKWD
jgi:hypothetical protein